MHEFMSVEERVAAGGVLTQVIGWVAGGGRLGGSQRHGNVNTRYPEHWDTGADNIQHTTIPHRMQLRGYS